MSVYFRIRPVLGSVSWRIPTTILILILCALSGCAEEDQHALLLEVRTRTLISELQVQVKRYEPEGGITIFPAFDTRVDSSLDGYVATVNGTPIRLNIELPSAGRYAVHVVATPIDSDEDRLVATTCHAVDGAVYGDGLYLGRLTAELDADRDTFPEDGNAFCAVLADAGLPCDRSCAALDFLAMIDCNPDEDFDVPAGCGELGSVADWNPFVIDPCGDCFDQDCWNGDALCQDRDGDGYPGNVDCNDDDPTINPGADEVCGDGIDDNCFVDIEGCESADLPCDDDGDGFLSDVGGCGDDCDDSDAAINPVAFEGYGSNPENPSDNPGCDDTVDNNCDGRINERCTSDFDSDGVDRELDCDDCNAAVGPGFREFCNNGVDEDCDGSDQVCAPNDVDEDGEAATPSGSDCDDTDATVYPGAPDFCGDGIAQDCSADVACASITDADGDSFGAGEGDCDDSDLSINPWAAETCDALGVDEDCDGYVNEISAASAGSLGCGYEPETSSWRAVDFSDDQEHCGSCHHSCCLGPCECEGDSCVTGDCQCASGPGCAGGVTDYCCPDGCRDITSDIDNCGLCGNHCVLNEECRGTGSCGRGECYCAEDGDACAVIDSTADACCAGVGCTNVTSDPQNCGDCGVNCRADVGAGPRGDLCSPDSERIPRCYCGTPGVVCTGETWCTVVTHPGNSCGCADLNNDPNHCGTCDVICDLNEICDGGSCYCEAADQNCGGEPTEACCDDGCVNLLTDVDNCGVCGRQCRGGEQCSDGACTCTGTCNDGDDCTEDECVSERCVHRTLDADDDGYCADHCDATAGDCIAGDCDDSDPDINPGAREDCGTSDDDDCNGETNDQDAIDCTVYRRDTDDDGFGRAASQCLCSPSGEWRTTVGGDCDDSNDAINPDESEDCNGVDDDCDGDTGDGADDCSGGAGYCCGSTPACRTCCTDTQCPGAHNRCSGFSCSCEGSWFDCEDTCDCDGSASRCCGGSCIVGGECCNDGDCGSGDWVCSGNRCTCAGQICGDECIEDANCCNDFDCPGTHDSCVSNACECDSGWFDCGGTCNCNDECCGGSCEDCCDDGDCSSSEVCCGNSCVAGECCDDDDCGPHDTCCPDGSCQRVGDGREGQKCCTTTNCNSGLTCCVDGDHECHDSC